MKKLFVLTFCMVMGCFSSNVIAQSSYLSFNVGYGLPMNGQNMSALDFYSSTTTNTSNTIELERVSLGKGLKVGAAFGHMFSPYIGAEVEVSYLLGGESEAIQKDDFGSFNKLTLSSNMIRVIPAVIFSAGLEKINPYARVGLIVGSGSIKYNSDANNDGDIDISELKLNGGLSLGLNTAIGATFSLNDKMALFGELNLVSQTYSPKKGELTKLNHDGVNDLPDATVREKEIEFVDSYTYDFQNPAPDTEPRKELKQDFSYGSVGINFGFKISF